MISTPPDAERFDAYARAARLAQGNRKERIWWHFPYIDENGSHLGDMYVSLSPGEFRSERPDDGAPIIEGPEPEDPRRLTKGLADVLAELLSFDARDAEEEKLVQRARHVLRLTTPAAVREQVAAFREDYRRLVDSGLDVLQIERKLLEWYWNRRLPGLSFNCEYAYLAIAHRTGVQIEPGDGSTADPEAMLHTFVRDASHEHPQIVDEASKLANVQFTWGREQMRNALESTSLRRFYDGLFVAAHHFLICTLISRFLEARNAIGKLDFQPFVAEEGWAGLQAAILWDITGEATDYEQVFLACFNDDDDEEAQRDADFLTSATNPIYPRPVVKLWFARAMARAGGRHAADAVPILEKLEAAFPAGDYSEPEYFQLMTGLVAAYKATGDAAAAERTATRLMGVMLIREALRDA